jgi:hypothetical protein
MSVFEQLIQSNNRESIWIDYKMKIDFVGNRIDFLRDVIAFANNSFEGHQYIIYGVKEIDGHLELTGLNNSFDKDDSEFQQLIYENIEPIINISFSKHMYENKLFILLTIDADKSQRPFMFKKKYIDIDEGDSYIRVGSSKKRMLRSDFESIYNNNNKVIPIEVSLRDKELFINDQDPGKLEIIIKNYSHIDRLFTDIFLVIEDESGNRLIISRMHAFKTKDEYQKGTFDSDFALSIPKQAEVRGIGEFSFGSTDAIRVGLNEYGESEKRYIFKLVFRYDEIKEYQFEFQDCTIFAKGAVLWKIQKHAKEIKSKTKKIR